MEADKNKTHNFSATCSLTGDVKTLSIKVIKEAVAPRAPQHPCDFYLYTNNGKYYDTFLESNSEKVEVFTWGMGSQIQAFLQEDTNQIISGGPDVNYKNGEAIISFSLHGSKKGSFALKVSNWVGGTFCDKWIYINVDNNRGYNPNYVQATFNYPVTPTKEDCEKYRGGAEIPVIRDAYNQSVYTLEHSDLRDFGALSLYVKGQTIFYSGITTPDKLALVDKVCNANGGTSQWYSNANRTTRLNDFITISGYSTAIIDDPDFENSKTYYTRCTFRNGSYCDKKVVVNPGMPANGRLNATGTETSTLETAANCTFSKQKATDILLSDVLCQKLSLVPGKEREKLLALKEALLAQQVQLADITDAMVADLAAGKCSEVVTALTANIEGNESAATLNETLVNQQNIDKLLSDVVDEMSVELLSLSATATDATCAADDGSINLEATGGVTPYQYSIDDTIFQDNPIFVELKVGTYTITVRDSKSAIATATASIMLVPDIINVELSSYQPPVTATNARTDQRSTITVQWGTTGVPYTFTPKTGVTIEYIAGGKVHVTTTDPADKHWDGDYGVYFENNHDIFVGFYKGTNLQKCSPSGYGIDCQPMCKEGFLPQEIYDESFVPYVLAASVHRKGMNDDNTGIHHDMESCDMTNDQIIALNGLSENELSSLRTEADLVIEWKRMASFQSMGKLANNIMAMIDKFARSEGGEYSNTDLTRAGKNHKSTRRFIDNINTSLAFELTKDPDFVKKQGILKYIVNGEEQQRKDIPSPTWDEKFTGLGIAVNDTWGYDAKIESFTIDKVSRSYQAKISVEIFDHFGLDANDIDPTIKPIFAALSGFRSWFVLQHSKKYCKKPFVTIVNFEESINGTY